jgi:ABC-2 type transport system permease protein
MIGVLARLQWMLLKGRVVRSIRLLRQPKYLVGFIVGAGWMGLWVVRPLLKSKIHFESAPGTPFGVEFIPVIHQFAALFVTVALPLPWLLPWGRLGLPFRESELTMLLQAPLSRRQVIQYGLLKSEVGVLLSGLILPLFVGLGGPGARLLTGCGTCMLFEFWHLNGKWRALFNLRQTEISTSLARTRRLMLTIGLAGFYTTVLLALKPFVMQVGAAFSGGDYRHVAENLTTVTWPPLLKIVLTPGWWLTAPMFAEKIGAFAVAAAPMLLAILAQREIVLRSKARFEEGALEQATNEEAKKSPTQRFARVSSRARSMRPFELDPRGPPEIALVWKNAIRVSRARWTRIASVGAALLLAIALLPAVLRLHDVTYGVLAALGAVPMIILPLLAGMTWNNDLRTELAHIELVRTWPVSARRFVLAEVLSPALLSFLASVFGAGIVLTSLLGSRLRGAWTGQPSALVLLPRGGEFIGVHTGLATVLLFASFLPMAAAVSFFSSALQNLATLFVPAWMAHSADRSQGVAALGQRMLFSAGLGLALLLASIPSALLVGAAAGIQWWLGIPWSAWAFPFWGVLAATPLFALGWFIVQVAGRLWERLDPSQEILELGR